jgi:hypothetical protein
MGSLYAGERDREQAILHYRQAIDIFAELGEHDHRGETLMALSSVHMKMGHWGQALVTYHEGLSALQRPSIVQRFLRWLFGIPLKMMNR